jgi:hypothetical protein
MDDDSAAIRRILEAINRRGALTMLSLLDEVPELAMSAAVSAFQTARSQQWIREVGAPDPRYQLTLAGIAHVQEQPQAS